MTRILVKHGQKTILEVEHEDDDASDNVVATVWDESFLPMFLAAPDMLAALERLEAVLTLFGARDPSLADIRKLIKKAKGL